MEAKLGVFFAGSHVWRECVEIWGVPLRSGPRPHIYQSTPAHIILLIIRYLLMIFTFVVNIIDWTQYLGKPNCRSEAFNGILPKSQVIGTGCQIKLKMCQNIFYSCCFISQKACFFPFLMLEQHITSSFCQSHGWSILISHVFAWFMMGSSIYGKLPFEYLNDY